VLNVVGEHMGAAFQINWC